MDRLADAGHRLAVCTNKPSALAEVLLRELGIRERFAAMIGADTLPVRKPDPRPYRRRRRGRRAASVAQFVPGRRHRYGSAHGAERRECLWPLISRAWSRRQGLARLAPDATLDRRRPARAGAEDALARDTPSAAS
ncbi:HAD hydrolase-like protein [Paracoccus sp. DMF-8]|uniref:HAD family hydrolase n=1 Tax=Paracoccus sp. DMF-8 TaxID=3019445 RepID=UPI0023E4483E|nr:HAD family hydrolase [Paracoccus sp. DMF-8]MDF3607198.1 HAD hydrolase-like protein [Paracoccus sp. DMF-8]